MKNKNPLAQYATPTEKHELYTRSCANNEFAYKSDGTKVPLGTMNEDTVEFIGGLWRVQDDKKLDVLTVRDRQVVLGPRIQHNEKTFFEYYQASFLSYNCYGPIIFKYDMVVAKYATDKGIYWAYGENIPQARAFMGIRLYDEYMDLIHSVACKNAIKQRKK